MRSIVNSLKTRPVQYASVVLLMLQLHISVSIILILLLGDVFVEGSGGLVEGIFVYVLGTILGFIGGLGMWLLSLSRVRTIYLVVGNVLLAILGVVLFFIMLAAGIPLPPAVYLMLAFAYWQYFLIFGAAYLSYFRIRSVSFTLFGYAFWFFSIIIVSISDKLIVTSELSSTSILNNFGILFGGVEVLLVMIFLILSALLILVDQRFELGRWQQNLKKRVELGWKNWFVAAAVIIVAALVTVVIAPLLWRANWSEVESRQEELTQERTEQQQQNQAMQDQGQLDSSEQQLDDQPPTSGEQQQQLPEDGSGSSEDSVTDQDRQADGTQPNSDDSPSADTGTGDQDSGSQQPQQRSEIQQDRGVSGNLAPVPPNPGGVLPDNLVEGQDLLIALVRYTDEVGSPVTEEIELNFVSNSRDFRSLDQNNIKFVQDSRNGLPSSQSRYQYYRTEIYDSYVPSVGFSRTFLRNQTAIDASERRGFFYDQQIRERSQTPNSQELYQLVLWQASSSQQVLSLTDVFEVGMLETVQNRLDPNLFGYENGVIVTGEENPILRGDNYYAVSNLPSTNVTSVSSWNYPDLAEVASSRYLDLDLALADSILSAEISDSRNFKQSVEQLQQFLTNSIVISQPDSTIGNLTETANFTGSDLTTRLQQILNFSRGEQVNPISMTQPEAAGVATTLLHNLDNRMRTRVVGGFRTNDFQGGKLNSYIVTTNDLHYWTEIYVDDYGWVNFDPAWQTSNNREEQFDLQQEQTEQFESEFEELEQEIQSELDQNQGQIDDYYGDRNTIAEGDNGKDQQKDGDQQTDDGAEQSEQPSQDDSDTIQNDQSEPADSQDRNPPDLSGISEILEGIFRLILRFWYICCGLFFLSAIVLPPIQKFIRKSIWDTKIRNAASAQDKLDLAVKTHAQIFGYFSLAKPKPTSWKDYAESLQTELNQKLGKNALAKQAHVTELVQSVQNFVDLHEQIDYKSTDTIPASLDVNRLADLLTEQYKQLLKIFPAKALILVYFRW